MFFFSLLRHKPKHVSQPGPGSSRAISDSGSRPCQSTACFILLALLSNASPALQKARSSSDKLLSKGVRGKKVFRLYISYLPLDDELTQFCRIDSSLESTTDGVKICAGR